MRILKLLFSKIFISALALLIQIAFVVLILLFYEVYFGYFQIFSAALSLLIVFGIIGKKESPEFKAPWLVIILVLPFFGIRGSSITS